MKIPESLHSVATLIDQHHEVNQGRPRAHLGLSMAGHKCERYLWLNFRWAVIKRFNGRVLRLFRRGHLEEDTIIEDLRSIGMKVECEENGKQLHVNFGSHVSGSLDGVIHYGVPEAPKTPHLLEIKTHSKKSFDELIKQGVLKSKPMHYKQMQSYMLGKGLTRSLYFAICKDDDRIYTERVKFDKEEAEKVVERARRIATTERIPVGISQDETWFECRMCDAHEFCFKAKKTKEVNCRTCCHSTALPDSTWHCARWDSTIPRDAQHHGCNSHVLHPDLVPWKMGEPAGEWTANYDGVPNGEDGFSSQELLANFEACKYGDKNTNILRNKFNAKVVG